MRRRQSFVTSVVILLLAGCAGSSQLSPAAASRGVAAARGRGFSVVHFFTGRPDGELPSEGRLTFDGRGNLYGATLNGGTGRCKFRGINTGCGTIFELSPKLSGGWRERVLYSFKNGGDGARPYGTVTFHGGAIYGVTMAGGNRGCVPLFWAYRGCGTAFELVRKGNRWTKQSIHVFSGGADGGNPLSGLVADASGNLYGTAYCGGAQYSCYTEGEGAGVFFVLRASKSGAWTEQVLHAFGQRHGDGSYPLGDLTPDGTSTIYGTTVGSVYEMTRSSPSASWAETTLFSFKSDGSQGRNAQGGIAFDGAGNLYGVTYDGGVGTCSNGCGVIFDLTRSSSGTWTETILHRFSGGSDGAHSDAGLAIDSAGRLYGTSTNGGDLTCNNGGGCGVAFMMRPLGIGSTEHVLHTFEDDAKDGGMPTSGVALDRRNVYGTTEYGGPGSNLGLGTAFEITH